MIDRTGHECTVQFARQHAGHRLGRGAGAQREVHRRVCRDVGRDDARQPHRHRGLQRADRQRPLRRAIVHRRASGAGQQVLDLGGIGQQAAPAAVSVTPRGWRSNSGVPSSCSSSRTRAVTFDCTVFNACAARPMPPRRATVSNTFRSAASIAQNPAPGCARYASSSGVLTRPSAALRCGKRPNRRITSRWRSRVADRFLAQRVAQRLEQADRLVLVGEVLRMLERQIDEHALDRSKRLVEAAGDQRRARFPRLGIGGERLGRAAMQVAGELVQQDDQRQRAARRLGPVIERAGPGVANGGGETRARGVEFGVLLEPHLAVRGRIAVEPEVQHFIGVIMPTPAPAAARNGSPRVRPGRGSGAGRTCRRRR